MQTLLDVKNSACILEINTSSVLKQFTKQFYPSNWILNECFKLEIPVTVNADAHNPSQLNNLHSEAAALLLDIGYTEIQILDETGRKAVKFSKSGINVI